ncbi:MAG: serine hydrolase domain-containing protein [Syntrophobacteraceae bacterium]
MNVRIRLVIIFVIFIVIAITALYLINFRDQHLSSHDLDLKLNRLISELVKKDSSIRSTVLAVMRGDGSYFWVGAAGIANQNGHVPMTNDTPVYISSVTKLYTAVAVMKLYEENRLSLSDAISTYLPVDLIKGINIYKNMDYADDITIESLLSHSSGIADYYEERSKDGKSLFELFVEDTERSWTVNDTIKRARDELKPHFQPGAGVFYSDTNYQLLGKIIENITHKPLNIVLEEFFFRPLALRHTWLVGYPEPEIVRSVSPADIFYKDKDITKSRSNGAYWADGGIVSTAEEMIIFLKALNEGKLIKKDTLERMHNWRRMSFPIRYGYGTMCFKPPKLVTMVTKLTPLWGHSGSTGSFLYYSEDLNVYIAGSVNNVGSNIKPFKIMRNVMVLFNSR